MVQVPMVAGGLMNTTSAQPTSNVTGWTCFTENGLESIYHVTSQNTTSLELQQVLHRNRDASHLVTWRKQKWLLPNW